jgi:hypothetical protein
MPPPLANDLMASGERDEMSESLHGDAVAVMNQLSDRLSQGHNLSQVISRR